MYRTRLAPRTRAFLVDEASRVGVRRAARGGGTTRRTVYRWRARAGEYADRSSRPHRSPRRTPQALEAAVLGLRVETHWGPDLLGPYLGLAVSTTHRILRRHGAHRLRTLFPREPVVHRRFDVVAPGYIAIDVKSLGGLDRGGGREARRHLGRPEKSAVGWRHLFVAIDLASRLVYAELRPTLRTADAVAFLGRALAFFDARGIRVRRVLTDNAYNSVFGRACESHGARHTRTQPYHPWTNGRAEALINTLLRECLHVRRFTGNDERALAIALFVAYYNAERPHTSLNGLSPERWLRARGVTEVYGDFS